MPPAVAPSALSSWTRTVVDALTARGADVEKVLSLAGFAPFALDDPNARHSIEMVARLWRRAAQEVADPAFGLTVSKHMHPGTFHALGYAVLASASLEDALERIVRYYRLVSDVADLQLDGDASGVRLLFTLRPGFENGGEEAMDTIMSSIVRAARTLVGKRLAPKSVQLRRRQPEDPTPYERFFDCPLTFGSEHDVLTLNRAELVAKLPAANPELASHNDAAIRDYLARVAGGTLIDRVRATMATQLDRVSPSALARALGMSVRSMQRSLSEHGSSYEELLRDVRRELSCAYLQKGRHSVAEIAFLLGYEHPGAFARSFKRWTGMTPSEFAAKHK